MAFSVEQIANLCQGEVSGNPKITITSVAQFSEAEPKDLTFLFDEALFKSDTRAAVIILKKGTPLEKIVQFNPRDKNRAFIFVENPRLAMAQVLRLFELPLSLNPGIHQTAQIGNGAKIGGSVAIGAYAVIGEKVKIGKGSQIFSGAFIGNNCEIGDHSIVFPNVVIYQNVKIGNHVKIHSGTVIGVDGFGFVQSSGEQVKIPQIGTVIIEDKVEIFANCCIARATLGATIIKKGTKIDCATHIAHNCKIGQHCALAGQVGTAGSVTLEDRVIVAGQVGFKDHVVVGEGSIVLGKAGVTKNVSKNQVVSGFPATNHTEDLNLQAHLRRLPKLFKKIAELEKKLNETIPKASS